MTIMQLAGMADLSNPVHAVLWNGHSCPALVLLFGPPVSSGTKRPSKEMFVRSTDVILFILAG